MNKIIPNDYDGFARWDWMQTLASVLSDRGMVGEHIEKYGWDDLPPSYKHAYPDRNLANYRIWFYREKGSAPMHPRHQTGRSSGTTRRLASACA